jgi:hypothetical protein
MSTPKRPVSLVLSFLEFNVLSSLDQVWELSERKISIRQGDFQIKKEYRYMIRYISYI